jgi:hypothetical protein
VAAGKLVAEADERPHVAAVATLRGVALEGEGLANGMPGWFRVLDRDGNTVFDGLAGTEGADMTLTVDTIVSGAAFFILSGSIVAPSGEPE